MEEPMMSNVAVDGVSDVLVLAAIDRAERHSGRDIPGVPLWTVLGHLDVAARSKRAREVRVRLDELVAAGSLERARRHGVPVWVFTVRGRRRLSWARREGRVPVLPESTEHRAWREARGLAEQRIEGFWLDLLEAVEHARELLDAPAPGPPVLEGPGAVPGPASDVWFEAGERVQGACRRLGSASYCLWKWRKPEDARADVDRHVEPGDRAFDPEERDRLRARRRGRRNTLLWDSAPELVFLGRAIRQQREQQNITAGELAAKAGVGKRRLQRLEAGRLDPDFELLGNLADALSTKPSTFVVRAEALKAKGRPQ
jgi:ribosome-binding protein aMBF1 (putative translation factor)